MKPMIRCLFGYSLEGHYCPILNHAMQCLLRCSAPIPAGDAYYANRRYKNSGEARSGVLRCDAGNQTYLLGITSENRRQGGNVRNGPGKPHLLMTPTHFMLVYGTEIWVDSLRFKMYIKDSMQLQGASGWLVHIAQSLNQECLSL